MTNATVRVYVNGKGFDVPTASSALDAVRLADAVEGDAITSGSRLITDSRGLAVPADTPVYAGVIYRVVTNRARTDGQGE
jgi:hypothetical protein